MPPLAALSVVAAFTAESHNQGNISWVTTTGAFLGLKKVLGLFKQTVESEVPRKSVRRRTKPVR